jgi:hypothetical protein
LIQKTGSEPEPGTGSTNPKAPGPPARSSLVPDLRDPSLHGHDEPQTVCCPPFIISADARFSSGLSVISATPAFVIQRACNRSYNQLHLTFLATCFCENVYSRTLRLNTTSFRHVSCPITLSRNRVYTIYYIVQTSLCSIRRSHSFRINSAPQLFYKKQHSPTSATRTTKQGLVDQTIHPILVSLAALVLHGAPHGLQCKNSQGGSSFPLCLFLFRAFSPWPAYRRFRAYRLALGTKIFFSSREKRKRYHTRHMAVKSPPTAYPFLFVQGTKGIHCITACASAR